MSLRVIAAVLGVLFLMAYAWSPGWRKLRPGWFISTCGAVMMMAVLERHDMPRSIGIPGVNLWNLLMINNVVAWLSLRPTEGYSWDLPRRVKTRGFLFCAVMFVAFLRVLIEDHPLAPLHGFNAFAKYFINCFKWLLPGLILFDGARSEDKTRTGLLLVLSTYVVIALFTIKSMATVGLASGDQLSAAAAKRLNRDVGYHRVDASMILAGATCAIWSCAGLFRQHWQRLGVIGLGFVTLLGQALTGGRMGYASFIAIAGLFALLKWRKMLLLGPVGLMMLLAFVPAARERMMQGFGSQQGAVVQERDLDEITSGRVLIWPLCVEGILEKPLIGWGREGFLTSGLGERAISELQQPWPHPHNAYLEWLLDTGIVGFLLAVPLYATMVFWGFRLFRKQDPLMSAVGGSALSLFLALILASFGAQTFYTREGTVMMWAVAGLLVRCWLENEKLDYDEETDFVSGETEPDVLDGSVGGVADGRTWPRPGIPEGSFLSGS